MVATRNHPKDFEAPVTEPTIRPSPAKRAPRTSTVTATATTTTQRNITPSMPAAPLQSPPAPRSSLVSAPTRTLSTRNPTTPAWSHTPSNLTLIWLAISLPLVIWDTGYVLLRPYSMPGGALHSPLWVPYELYGRVDHVYGWKSYNAHNGWTSAQGAFNAVETVAYLVYLYMVYAYGRQEKRQGRGAPRREKMGLLEGLARSRTVEGRVATYAVLLGFSTAWLTFSKTVLYWLNEAFSGFDNIGHNDTMSLIFLWIIPNGAWLVFPTYMMYVFGQEILQGLVTAAGGGKKNR
ncbi:hypothetical protein LTR35_005263 [Friedmanniomyces endolithicus]|uniref:EXPERA domain-containing protein n=1 Tax=Friedmanniomyces endolithicus TaxID=329885 RepID=A0AAN6JEB8_9PEZI|nr:hypothetical protein LTR35_005263 [Friedmanniomyces endolithicus]KAK0299535.1 hypothetical protein LTS00_001978 [Friedmanniomyces endolithicus]KAK0327028.1 hypothetical protein LTR82_001788 [Friedmanniomyces endolithicus]KAK1019137.1 hypothetical protein LTR54_000952 [Friedmanniomyces endolithicus]